MDNTAEFKQRLANTRRDGVGELIDWLDTTDFFRAPASTRFHEAWEGGLLEHSLRVHDWLQALVAFYIENPLANGSTTDLMPESVAVVALCHDFCKIGLYKTEMRWRKDKFNRWEKYPTYKIDEDFPFGGHGSKSVYLIHHFIKLSSAEASAINCHMGPWDQSPYGKPSAVFETNPLAWLLHVADEAATYNVKEENHV